VAAYYYNYKTAVYRTAGIEPAYKEMTEKGK